MRRPMISRPPRPKSPASKEIIAASEKRACAPCIAGSVMPSVISPIAVEMRPSHWRRRTSKPNIRSAITAMKTTPAASETCTTDIGAIASAATWKPQLTTAMSMPSANQPEE